MDSNVVGKLENLRGSIEETFRETEKARESCRRLTKELDTLDRESKRPREALVQLNFDIASKQQALLALEDKLKLEMEYTEVVENETLSISEELEETQKLFTDLSLKMQTNLSELQLHYTRVHECISIFRERHDMAAEDLSSLGMFCQSQNEFGTLLKQIEYQKRLINSTKIQRQEAEKNKATLVRERHGLVSI